MAAELEEAIGKGSSESQTGQMLDRLSRALGLMIERITLALGASAGTPAPSPGTPTVEFSRLCGILETLGRHTEESDSEALGILQISSRSDYRRIFTGRVS